MEEKEKKLRFFRAILLRDNERDPAFNRWLSQSFDNKSLRKFKLTLDRRVVFGIVTDSEEITKEMLPKSIAMVSNAKIRIEELNFEEWDYPDNQQGEYINANLEFITINYDCPTEEVCFNGFFYTNDIFKVQFFGNCNEENKKLFYRIFNTEISYGRKRKKSVVSNRPTV